MMIIVTLIVHVIVIVLEILVIHIRVIVVLVTTLILIYNSRRGWCGRAPLSPALPPAPTVSFQNVMVV